jgi:hypothetical protein
MRCAKTKRTPVAGEAGKLISNEGHENQERFTDMILDFGKYKGRILADCPPEYLQWLTTHEKVLAVRNRWAARDARFILERRAQVVAQEVALKEFEARKEAEMAVRIAQHIVSTPAKVDLAFKGNSNVSRAFSLLR